MKGKFIHGLPQDDMHMGIDNVYPNESLYETVKSRYHPTNRSIIDTYLADIYTAIDAVNIDDPILRIDKINSLKSVLKECLISFERELSTVSTERMQQAIDFDRNFVNICKKIADDAEPPKEIENIDIFDFKFTNKFDTLDSFKSDNGNFSIGKNDSFVDNQESFADENIGSSESDLDNYQDSDLDNYSDDSDRDSGISEIDTPAKEPSNIVSIFKTPEHEDVVEDEVSDISDSERLPLKQIEVSQRLKDQISDTFKIAPMQTWFSNSTTLEAGSSIVLLNGSPKNIYIIAKEICDIMDEGLSSRIKYFDSSSNYSLEDISEEFCKFVYDNPQDKVFYQDIPGLGPCVVFYKKNESFIYFLTMYRYSKSELEEVRNVVIEKFKYSKVKVL